jgi:hypothetical protein
LRLTGGATFRHALTALFAKRLPSSPAFADRDEAVAVDVQPGEGLFSLAPYIGDQDRPAGLHAPVAMGQPGAAAMHAGRTGGALRASLGRAWSIELGAADGPVAVGVQTLEAGVGALGRAGLEDRAPFLRRHGAVAVSISGAQTVHPPGDELGLADAAVAVGVRSQDVRLGRRLLSEGSAACGEGQGGEGAGQEGFSHQMISRAARRGRFIPV